jgi:hypothetical protein
MLNMFENNNIKQLKGKYLVYIVNREGMPIYMFSEKRLFSLVVEHCTCNAEVSGSTPEGGFKS